MDRLFNFVIKSRQAISVVDDPYFKEYSEALDERFVTPTRQAFANTILEEKFGAMIHTINGEYMFED